MRVAPKELSILIEAPEVVSIAAEDKTLATGAGRGVDGRLLGEDVEIDLRLDEALLHQPREQPARPMASRDVAGARDNAGRAAVVLVSNKLAVGANEKPWRTRLSDSSESSPSRDRGREGAGEGCAAAGAAPPG